MPAKKRGRTASVNKAEPEATRKKSITIQLTDELYLLLKRYAEERAETPTGFARRLLIDTLIDWESLQQALRDESRRAMERREQPP